MRGTVVRLLSTGMLGLGLMLGGTAPQASADILPQVGSPTITPLGGGQFRWDYNVLVTSTQNVLTGDYFTIYDMAGIVSVSGPAGFTPSIQLTGIDPVSSVGTTSPTDDPTVNNVTFTRTGADIINNTGGPLSLGTFSIVSTVSTGGVTAFGGRGTDRDTGLKNANITGIQGPQQNIVPEPGTYAMFGLGLLGMAAFARRRRNKTEA